MREETRYPGEPRFHYRREDREAGLSDYAKRNLHTRGFFRRNRSLAITLIDLLVLLLLFIIINVYLRSRPGPELIEGLTVTSDAYLSAGRVYVTIAVERTGESGPEGTVRILLRVLPDDKRLDMTDVLPQAEGESRTIRGVLDISSSEPPRLFATFDTSEGRVVTEIDVRGSGP